MNKEAKPPKKKPHQKEDGPESTAGKRPGERETATSKPTIDTDPQNSGKPSQEEVIKPWRDPVTNQDEQEKITNAGGDDIPIPD